MEKKRSTWTHKAKLSGMRHRSKEEVCANVVVQVAGPKVRVPLRFKEKTPKNWMYRQPRQPNNPKVDPTVDGRWITKVQWTTEAGATVVELV